MARVNCSFDGELRLKREETNKYDKEKDIPH